MNYAREKKISMFPSDETKYLTYQYCMLISVYNSVPTKNQAIVRQLNAVPICLQIVENFGNQIWEMPEKIFWLVWAHKSDLFIRRV